MADKVSNPGKNLLVALSITLVAGFSSCKDDDDGKETVKEHNIKLETKQEIPTVMSRNETGTANLKLYADSTLSFNINVSNFDANDQLTLAHVHSGSPVESGPPVITLVDNNTVKFQGTGASGNVKLNGSQYAAIKDVGNFYVNVHSTKLPQGLLRGQLNIEFSFAQNVDLIPMSTNLRPETGTAIFRMAKDSVLHYKVTVNNLKTGDVLTAAQISVGATGVTGPAVIPLYSTAADYNMPKTVKLTASQVNFLQNMQIYVSVNSQQVPNELLRGQIR